MGFNVIGIYEQEWKPGTKGMPAASPYPMGVERGRTELALQDGRFMADGPVRERKHTEDSMKKLELQEDCFYTRQRGKDLEK